LAFELALATLEHFKPDQLAENVVVLAMFTVADDAIYDVIDTLGGLRLTDKQQAAFLDRVARFEALGTADIRASLYRYGCAPARQRIAN
jgi:predicted component of type VI protein secretion system